MKSDLFNFLPPRSLNLNDIRQKISHSHTRSAVKALYLDPFEATNRALPRRALVHELDQCEPILSHEDITRIRDNVLASYRVLYGSFSSIGGSLNADNMVSQYNQVWSAAEGGNYCVYQDDYAIAQETVGYLQGANQIWTNAGAQYANNFSNAFQPMRQSFIALQQASSAATKDIGPSLDAYNVFWSHNFQFNLYTGMNSNLDSFINEYHNLCNQSEDAMDQAVNKVQAQFSAAVTVLDGINGQIQSAYVTWNTIDGNQGYSSFSSLIPTMQSQLTELKTYVVAQSPQSDQLFSKINDIIADVSNKWNGFPNFIEASPSTGIMIDPSTSSLKMYARQLTLNIMSQAGVNFNNSISPKESLIVTGLSYQHGGYMPPHKEHKDGRDCDVFSVRFKQGDPGYSSNKTIATIAYLLKLNVSRVIYTDDAVVKAANNLVPGNAVAVNLPGHTTHIHFDTDAAI